MFRTEFFITPSNNKITLQNSVLTIGSCFSDNIGERLKVNKISSLANPLGIVYNPLSLFKILEYCCQNQMPPEETFVKQRGIYYNLDFHSEYSSKSLDNLKDNVKEGIELTHEFLKKTDWIIITLGTAFVYEHNNTGNIVNNCHKIPAREFTKKLLNADQIAIAFEFLYRELVKINSDYNIVFTVSPVRHIKETMEGNFLSKSVLRVAIQQIQETYPAIDYFPSYEILMDDLRDYRFYKEDMIHANKVAIDYIWDKFTKKYFDVKATQFLDDWEKIVKAMNHRPFHPDAPSHQEFLKKTIERLNALQQDIDISEELETLKKQIK